MRQLGFSEETCLAGLLYDIIEDGNTTFDELRDSGFSPRVIELVGLCTEDETVDEKEARWLRMVARLSDANDPDAWVIKLVDITDNLKDAATMTPERAKYNFETKRPLLLALTRPLLGDSEIWKELESMRLQ